MYCKGIIERGKEREGAGERQNEEELGRQIGGRGADDDLY